MCVCVCIMYITIADITGSPERERTLIYFSLEKSKVFSKREARVYRMRTTKFRECIGGERDNVITRERASERTMRDAVFRKTLFFPPVTLYLALKFFLARARAW